MSVADFVSQIQRPSRTAWSKSIVSSKNYLLGEAMLTMLQWTRTSSGHVSNAPARSVYDRLLIS
jgi:hypothetical protein